MQPVLAPLQTTAPIVAIGTPPRVVSITVKSMPAGVLESALTGENAYQVLRNADGSDLSQTQPAALMTANQTIAATSMSSDGVAIPNTANLQISVAAAGGHVAMPTGLPMASVGSLSQLTSL